MAAILDPTQAQTQQMTSVPGLAAGTTRQTGATTTGVIDGVAQAGMREYDPSLRTVQSNETVQGQLKGILSEESPLMQQARAKALEGMQQRGLSNSAMAQSAGQAAVIEKSLQIATPDAATYGLAARDNQSVSNDALKNNADAYNKTQQFNSGETNRFGVQKMSDTASMDRTKVTEAGAMDRTKLTESGAMDRTKLTEAGALNRTNITEAGATARTEISARTNMAVAEMNKQATLGSATLSANAQLEATRMNNEANYAINAVNREFQSEIENNRLGAGMVENFTRDVMAIQTNPDLDKSYRDELLRQRTDLMNQGLTMIKLTAQITGGDSGGGLQPAAQPGVAPPPGIAPPPAAAVPAPAPYYSPSNAMGA